MRAVAIVCALGLVTAPGCILTRLGGKSVSGQMRPDHLQLRGSKCFPARGAPPAPELGMATPLRLGIGSIVHLRDGTSESFLARDAMAEIDVVPGRTVEVLLVDHPVDADYTISGTIRGSISYSRRTNIGAGTRIAMVLGTMGTGIFLILGTTFAIARGAPDPGPMFNLTFLSSGIVMMGYGHIWTTPANHYSWRQVADLSLRRNGVLIGEFVITDHQSASTLRAERNLRATSLAGIWKTAAAAMGGCIRADLEGPPK